MSDSATHFAPNVPAGPSRSARTTGSATQIDDRVFRVMAIQGALSVPGVINHASGITRFTGRSLPRGDVHWDGLRTSVTIDLQIAVTWPSPVVDISRVVQETVRQWIIQGTGIPVSAVNVDVAAVVPASETQSRITAADLDSAPRAPELVPVSATPLPVLSPAVERAIPRPSKPVSPPAHPLRPIHAGRPTVPSSVPSPTPRTLIPVRTPERPELMTVTVPEHDSVTIPGEPTPPELRAIEVGHVAARPPEVPTEITVRREIPTPPGPQLENVPTPQGLPVRTTPTPRGLPLTVFPQVSRRGLTPVAVHRHPRIQVSARRQDALDPKHPTEEE